MKQILYTVFALLTGCMYTGCSKEEIELYEQTPRLNFNWESKTLYLDDEDYLENASFYVDSFEVRIQGDLLKEQRTLCVKAVTKADYKTSPEITFEDNYVYTNLDKATQIFYFKVKRPEVIEFGNKIYGCTLQFDQENPKHQFDRGLVENQQLSFAVVWDIQPNEDDWHDWYWGEYSNTKYMYMMDVCGITIKEMNGESGYDDYDDYDKVVAAYNEYLLNNPPLVDENGNEIQF